MATEELQAAREAAAREAALGQRMRSINSGHMGPVLKRWVNADVTPVASLVRKCAVAYLEGDMVEVATLLDAPTAEISSRERPLAALMEWTLRGKSPGRSGIENTYADDLALAFLATITTLLTRQECTVGFALGITAETLRETCLGQFITDIQGASAMQAVRERNPELWQQKKSLTRICARLSSQVKPQIDAHDRGEIKLEGRGRRRVMTVLDHKGEERMLSLKAPDGVAWEVMSLCWRDETSGATQESRSIWLAFAGVLLAAAQRCSGWFDTLEKRQRHGKHVRKSKILVLSQEAQSHIRADAERWVEAGFNAEPMLIPPISGDYLTVKHRPITGQRAPLGLTTDPRETTAWTSGACALADTAWTVNPYSLDNPSVGEMEDPAAVMRIASHRRMGTTTPFYLPVTMDFRGRIYYQTPWVSPQSGDLGKSLLCFPDNGKSFDDVEEDIGGQQALVMHLSGLYGGPDKVDKAPYGKRLDWFLKWSLAPDFDRADKPLTLASAWGLHQEQPDRIPIQLDGTCNGLQHLSALLRDEEGAKHVNLTRSTLEDPPADIYGVVASMLHLDQSEAWAARFDACGLKVDRKVTKGPVMVLPYGGTREAVRLAVKSAVLERLAGSDAEGPSGPWRSYHEDQYGAFKDRDLTDHPLFNQDIGLLSGLIWDSIAPVIPKAMGAMGTLQAIGSWVGERGLSWRVGVGPEESRLWVTQAKSKGARKQVTMQGFHLPALVRRLTLAAHTNEIDPKAHRTGIVANFIHSQDAAHLAESVRLFRAAGGSSVGSVHDCVMVRPSEAALMGKCLRDAFVALYTCPADDRMDGEEFGGDLLGPLAQPVRLMRDKDTIDVEFPSWHHLADAAGVKFPELGSFDITEVRDSAWFFS